MNIESIETTISILSRILPKDVVPIIMRNLISLEDVIVNDNVLLLKYIIKNGGDSNQFIKSYNNTPLYVAARYGRLDCLRFLIKAGGDPNMNLTGNPFSISMPIFVSAYNQHRECYNLLIESGADVSCFANLVDDSQYYNFSHRYENIHEYRYEYIRKYVRSDRY